MVDIVDPITRSRMMSGIKGKDTKPEMILRKYLHSQGLRFRLHGKDLPGRPDLTLPKYKVAVFVHGCFWHSHYGCKYAVTPASNQKFWGEKLAKNVVRDQLVVGKLVDLGWRVLVVWECGIKHCSQRLDEVVLLIRSAGGAECWPCVPPRPKL